MRVRQFTDGPALRCWLMLYFGSTLAQGQPASLLCTRRTSRLTLRSAKNGAPNGKQCHRGARVEIDLEVRVLFFIEEWEG